MPTTIESQLTISNDNMADWTPRTQMVNGGPFVKLDCKDRACFRFLTGTTLHFGSKYENTKYLLDFWQYLVRARSDASQTAFENMHKDLQDESEAAGCADGGGRRKRQRIRKARMDDAMVAGRVVELHLAHNDVDHCLKALFGIKKSDLWIEATAANLEFVAAAMKADYEAGNFASTRPRGPHFRLQGEDEASNDGAGDDEVDGDAGPAEGNN
jgi:hypothetical protein